MVDLLHEPDVSRDGDLLAWRRRGAKGADLLRVAADGVLHALLEDGIELVIVCDSLAGKAHDEAAGLRGLHVVVCQEVAQQHTEVVRAYAVEGCERENARGQLGRRELALGGQDGKGLVAEQAVGQAVQARGLNPMLLAVELNEGNALQELPGEGLRREGPRLGLLFSHDEPHLGRGLASAGAAHALEEAGDGEGGVDLEGTLQASHIDAELEGRGGHDAEVRGVVPHELLGALPDAGGEVSVVDEEAVGLVVGLAVAPEGGGDLLGLLARIGEDEALATACVLKDVPDGGVGTVGGGVVK